MSLVDLLNGAFTPFLTYSYEEIKPFVHPALFRANEREKGLAVSINGKILRMVLKDSGYNNKFEKVDNAVRLIYVCGNTEEQRRQNKNRRGDEIMITLDDKYGYFGPKDRHGRLYGIFEKIVAIKDCKPDGTETFVPHSHIRITKHETAQGVANFTEWESAHLLQSKRICLNVAQHLVLDSESAAPLNRKHRSAFPMLQVAYERCDADFREVVHSAMWFLKYPTHLRNSLGNDEQSSKLKFSLQILNNGDDPYLVLESLIKQLRIVSSSGGFVFAHNVEHDVNQIRKTAQLLEFELPSFTFKAIDTVKTAPNFVPNMKNEWLELGKLAKIGGIDSNEELHRADSDTTLLRRIVQKHFCVDALEYYAEQYTLDAVVKCV